MPIQSAALFEQHSAALLELEYNLRDQADVELLGLFGRIHTQALDENRQQVAGSRRNAAEHLAGDRRGGHADDVPIRQIIGWTDACASNILVVRPQRLF